MRHSRFHVCSQNDRMVELMMLTLKGEDRKKDVISGFLLLLTVRLQL